MGLPACIVLVDFADLRGFDRGIDITLGLPLETSHAEDKIDVFKKASVPHERHPAGVLERLVGIGVAQGLHTCTEKGIEMGLGEGRGGDQARHC